MDLEIEYFMSEDEVAKELGICRSRVNTIQKKALMKLRRAFEEAGIEWQDITTEEE